MNPEPEPLSTLFDADNHYWESSDAFTRYRSAAFAERGVTLKEIDGRLRYVIGGRPHPWVPGPGDANPRPRPGALYDYFSGKGTKTDVAHMLTCEDPAEHPEWFGRDARLAVMDEQGLEGVWLFPSQGVCMEGPMQPDIDAAIDIYHGFNRWLDDEWGYAYQERIFGVPYLILSDVDAAVAEVERVIARGARVIAVRRGPVFARDGLMSPADPAFDPFWARVAEAGLIVAAHSGFDDGYREVEDAVARAWGYKSRRRQGPVSSLAFYEPFVDAVMHNRLIQDFLTALVAHGLFQRHPRLRVASVENGATWVPELLRVLRRLHTQNRGLFQRDPVEQFHEHVWISPFAEDDLLELARYIPVERILFGSDWPHAEGVAEPRQYLDLVAGFSESDQRRIMRDNARDLMRS